MYSEEPNLKQSQVSSRHLLAEGQHIIESSGLIDSNFGSSKLLSCPSNHGGGGVQSNPMVLPELPSCSSRKHLIDSNLASGGQVAATAPATSVGLNTAPQLAADPDI